MDYNTLDIFRIRATPSLKLHAPLAGLSIVVTRPPEQALQLAQFIEQAGGNAVMFPLLEIGSTADMRTLNALVARLHEFKLAIFISPNAVRYGMEAIRENNVFDAVAEGRGDLKIAAVGQGSAKALRNLGVQKIIVPQARFDSEALLELPALQKVQGWRVLIFRGNGGRELLGETLKARGAMVEYAECYRRSKSQLDGAILLADDIHAITVTSSEALSYLWNMFDDVGQSQLCEKPLFVSHARIADAARHLGWRNVITTAAGDAGMFLSLLEFRGQRTEDRGQRIEDRGQRTEDRGQRTED